MRRVSTSNVGIRRLSVVRIAGRCAGRQVLHVRAVESRVVGFGPALRQLGADFGFTQLVIGACVTIWVIMLLLSGSSIGGRQPLSALSPSPASCTCSAKAVRFRSLGGRWWTVLSAGWLHAGLLHILFNMYWLYMMGPAISELFGPSRTVIIYTMGGVAGFLLSSLAGVFLYWMPISFLRPGAFTVGRPRQCSA